MEKKMSLLPNGRWTLYLGDTVIGWVDPHCTGENDHCKVHISEGKLVHAIPRTPINRNPYPMPGGYHFMTEQQGFDRLYEFWEEQINNA